MPWCASRANASRRSFMVRFVALVAPIAVMGSTAGAADIVWRVENPFRLLTDPAATALHRARFEQLTPDERANPVLSIERRLAIAAPRGWAEAVVARTCWSDREQRYTCPEAADYAHPPHHRIIVGLAGAPDGICHWTVTTQAASDWPTAKLSSLPCRGSFALEVPYPNGVSVGVTQEGRPLARATIRVRDVLIVGIGDSFASGDGNPDGPIRFDDRRELNYRGPPPAEVNGYPARVGDWASPQDPAFQANAPRWLSSSCHRSLYGHHARAALQLALEDPHRAVTFASFACWGAEIVAGLFLPIRSSELVPGLPRLSQLSAVAALQCQRDRITRKDWPRAFEMGGALPDLSDLTGLFCPPAHARRIDLLLIAGGGNDAGFSRLVANAVLSDTTSLRTISGWLGQLYTPAQARRAMLTLPQRYKALNRAAHTILHIPWSQADRIVLTSYPPIALNDVTGDACIGGSDGMTVNPAFHLDQRRTRDAEQIGREIFTVMARAARSHGWTFVDAHRDLFTRHGLCAGRADRLANPADDMRMPRRVNGSWHPYAPSQWEPYTPRRRWVRTPNDGYLTVNFHFSKIGDDVVNLMLASSYSGAFHPTAEGHAAIADAVVVKARAVLEKYATTR